MSYFFTSQEIRQLFLFSKLKENIQNKFSFNFESLKGYLEVEELRCLNNAIKHNGFVSSELNSANSKWITNSKIENTYDDFLRLIDGPNELLNDLYLKIKPLVI